MRAGVMRNRQVNRKPEAEKTQTPGRGHDPAIYRIERLAQLDAHLLRGRHNALG